MLRCDLHDYLEIACVFRLSVRLTLANGTQVQGIASTIVTQDKTEYLLLSEDADKEATQLVAVADIQQMRALDTNPHFDVVNFAQT